nr:hypothetical protein [Desulforamulus aquiferis]
MALEIGKLSDRTASAVNQTAAVLLQMKKDVDSVVLSINNSLDSSNVAADKLNQVGMVFEESFNLIKKVNLAARDTFEDINVNLQQLAVTLEARNRDLGAIVSTGKLMTNLADQLEVLVGENQLNYVVKSQAESRIETIKAILNDVSMVPDITLMETEKHNDVLSGLKEEHVEIEAIWSNDQEGNFIFSFPEAALANAKVRQWWQEAINGRVFVSPVYISAITRKPCLTVAVPIAYNGNIIGVLGADIGLG